MERKCKWTVKCFNQLPWLPSYVNKLLIAQVDIRSIKKQTKHKNALQ